MMQKRVFSLIGLALLLVMPVNAQTFGFLTGACPGEEEEADVEVGETMDGRLDEDETLWFTFEGAENDIWRLEIAGEDDAEFFVGILDPETRLIEDFSEENLFFHYSISNPPVTTAFITDLEGVYCLLIRNEDNGSIDYEITLQPFERNRRNELRDTDELDVYGLNEIGNWYYYQNDFAASLDYYEAALDLAPDDYVVLGNACGSAYLMGDYDEAIDYCDESLDIEPNDYAFWNRALAYQSIGDYEQATDDFDELIDLDPNNPSSYYDRSLNALLNGEFDNALDDMEESFDIGRYEDLYWLGIVQLFAGEYEDARESLEESVEMYADDDMTAPFHNFWLGVIADLEGERERTIEGFLDTALDEATSIEPISENRLRALLALIQEDMDSAQSFYQEVLDASNLPHNRVNDLIYLRLLNVLYPDDLVYFAMLDWFETELGF